MNFNKEQLEALKPYEDNFRTAVYSDWSRYPGKAGLDTIHRIWAEATGEERRVNYVCQNCILTMLKDCGRLYFSSRQAYLESLNDKKAVELTQKKASTRKKASVKTKK